MKSNGEGVHDEATAKAFSTSWNNLPGGSVYTRAQFEDWMAPLGEADFRGKHVLELGCGNASLLVHTSKWQPARLVGVDLGDSVLSAQENMRQAAVSDWQVLKADLVSFDSDGYDVVYCIGVLHHLKTPRAGFDAVVRNVKPGGHFHCWVYGREGNAVVRMVVEPIRHVACHLPWWATKYLLATPLIVPYYFYAKMLSLLAGDRQGSLGSLLSRLPLFDYSLWIAQRDFAFFRHVAFDQLVTPQTVYLARSQVEEWLSSHPGVDQASTYLIARNGNSWKFGGRTRSSGGG